MDEYLEMIDEEFEDIQAKLKEVEDRNYFASVAKKGKEYFSSGKVTELKLVTPDTYTAIVKGTQDYKVIIKMNGDYCTESECTCPYNTPINEEYINFRLCKHIYAVQKSIYEIKNREYLNEKFNELKEKYDEEIFKIVDESKDYDISKKEIKLIETKKAEYIKCKEKNEALIYDVLDCDKKLEIIHEFLYKSAEVLNTLEKTMENKEEKEVIEEEESLEIIENESKQKFSFWNLLGEIFGGIFGGILEGISSTSEENSNEEKSFKVGDTVWVRKSRVGVVIGKWSENTYRIKLKDEFGKEYYESFPVNELEKYY